MASKQEAVDRQFAEATALHKQGRLPEAISSYQKILDEHATHAGATNLLGVAFVQAGRLEEALSALQDALKMDPNQFGTLYNTGIVLQKLERNEEATDYLSKAIAINPGDSEAHNNLGVSLKALGRLEEAVVSYRKALGLASSSTEARINLATALFVLERYDEALQESDKVLALNSSLYEAHLNRGRVLQALHRDEDALRSLDQALALRPERMGVRLNRSIIYLLLERFHEGWKSFDLRFSEDVQQAFLRLHAVPMWDGKSISGPLAIWGEQGVGDQILHASIIRDVLPHAGSVVLEIHPKLTGLFARSFPAVRLHSIRDDPRIVKAEAQIPIAGLGKFYRQCVADFPRQAYLVPDYMRAKRLRGLLHKQKKIIGISWRSLNPDFGSRKTADLRDFYSLFTQPDIELVDLQYGDTTSEIEAVRKDCSVSITHLNEIDNLEDLDGLAALIEACDAVVTVSNTTAHLAGAIGKRVWVLVPYHAHGKLWHWFKDRKDSLWYPEARICRQQKGQSWADLIASVTPEIVEFLQTKKDGSR